MRYLTNEAMLIEVVKHRQEATHEAIIHKPELCIMCTLHMELRIGEYCLTEMARELHYHEAPKRNEKMEEMSRFIADCFAGTSETEGIADEDDRIHQFNVALDTKNSKQIGTIKMSAARQKKVMRRIDELVDIVMSADLAERRGIVNTNAQYKELFQKYKGIVELLQRVDDIRDDEVAIKEVQNLLDQFTRYYTTMLGPTKVTNYIHALSSGH